MCISGEMLSLLIVIALGKSETLSSDCYRFSRVGAVVASNSYRFGYLGNIIASESYRSKNMTTAITCNAVTFLNNVAHLCK
jgi:hypothetical protein